MSSKSPQRQIIVLGGGGFSMERRNPRLDLYVLNAAAKDRPRICFVPTASGDSPLYIRRFHRAFEKHRCRPSDLSLFKRDARDPAKHLLQQDIIYVGGGNTANLLAIWRVHGIDRIMREAWRRGIVLCGISAGMICWFDCSVTDSFGPLAPLRDSLGLLPGSACPHYDGERHRRPTFHKLIAKGFPAGVAADDGAAIHFARKRILRCVSSRPNAQAYRVWKEGGKVMEQAMQTSLLHADGTLSR